MTRNQIDYWNLQEQKRNNMVVSKESNRHNLATEGLTLQANMEQGRHNVATENLGMLNYQETSRSNRARENLQQQNINLGYANFGETSRHNLVTEGQGWANINENLRSHLANESIGWGNIGLGYSNLFELNRSNLANESIRDYANTLNFLNYGATVNRNKETRRHNLAQEEQARKALYVNTVSDLGQGFINNYFNVGRGITRGLIGG